MVKRICCILIICISFVVSGQENKKYYDLDINNFYGTILEHNPDISHLITGHPSGIIMSLNKKTFGNKEWQRLYNAPDYGVSFIYQDLDNEFLGDNIGLYAHYNFYFLNRSLMLRIGQGVAYTTNPYDEDENFRNVAYGSHFLSSTFALLNFKKENIVGGLGLNAGIGVIHYSNANFKAPNKSTNTFLFNVGVNYLIDSDLPEYIEKEKGLARGSEAIGFGAIVRSGINESDVVGSGQYPFLTIGVFADKRLNKKSAIQLGAELFFSRALERFIDFRATGNFNDGTTGDEDAKRIGVFLGHELRINKLSVLTQLGYYAYYPYDFEGDVYNRIGLQYYFTKNIFSAVTVRSHAAKAEAVEFSLGYRL
ncbi:acyloxyacyl hydrolase [Aquimarina sp. 2201CG5-10]|uniref:acyloxyacyl hydrolase n=1 Tax=Aquimarina callyspongiae TaxID=3098150 RepID=UPI002AB5355E|nr:acyloxyacyl hydrolase [Aquimarina sp. 2201CG5-10]MDY8136514.1 acyloxyacyl hydrolase [Aquimarina sp. 2201CG5-10]